jgi:hypothetical protein
MMALVPSRVLELIQYLDVSMTDEDREVRLERYDGVPADCADLSLVEAKFMEWLLTSNQVGLPRVVSGEVRVFVDRSAELWKRAAGGENVPYREWAALRIDARSLTPTGMVDFWALAAAGRDNAKEAATDVDRVIRSSFGEWTVGESWMGDSSDHDEAESGRPSVRKMARIMADRLWTLLSEAPPLNLG